MVRCRICNGYLDEHYNAKISMGCEEATYESIIIGDVDLKRELTQIKAELLSLMAIVNFLNKKIVTDD